jgi:hypothetical protein
VAKFANEASDEAEGKRIAAEVDGPEARFPDGVRRDRISNYLAREDIKKDMAARGSYDLDRVNDRDRINAEDFRVSPMSREFGYEDGMEVVQAPEGYEGRSVEDIREKYKADAYGPTIGDEAAAELTSRFDPEDIHRWWETVRNMRREGEDPTTIFSPKFLKALRRGAPKIPPHLRSYRPIEEGGPLHTEGIEESSLRHRAHKGLRDLEEEFPEEGE